MKSQIVYCGWDTPPSEALPGVRSLAAQSPRHRGIDGYTVQAVRKGTPNNLLNIATNEPWDESDFARSEPGGTLLWARLLNPAKAPVDWSDDGRWKMIGDKLRMLGIVAKRLGCKSVLLDIEAYAGSPSLFQPRAPTDREFALRRGKELQPEFPLSFHRLLSHLIDVVPPPGAKQSRQLDDHLYGLLPSFAAGLIASGADLTDYCGTNRPRSPTAVHDQNVSVRGALPSLLEVDYQTVRIGQTIYLDQYVRKDSPEFLPMLQAYHDCADSGLLMYGEGARLCEPNPHIHAPPDPYPLWTEVIPEFSNAILRVADPATFAREYIAMKRSVLGEWRFGKPEDSAVTRDGMTLAGMGTAWLFQTVRATPGDTFALSAHSTSRESWLGARWQDHYGFWVSERKHSRRLEPDETGMCSGIAVAPDGCSRMIVTLAVNHTKPEGITTFSNPAACVVTK